MSEEKQVKWVCTRCGRRNDIELEADPVAYEVCDMCQVENHCRLIKGPVVITSEDIENMTDDEVDKHNADEVKVKITVDTTEAVEALEELEALSEEVTDPYKGLTKAQLVELLKEKE